MDIARKLLLPFSQSTDTPAEERVIAEPEVLIRESRSDLQPPSWTKLAAALGRVEATAWSVRDRLSLDTWRTIHALADHEGLPDETRSFDAPQARFYLDALVRRGAALSGLAAENMTRGPNWLFMELGRRIERAAHLAWAVSQIVGDADARESDHIRILLEIADSAMTYRSRYLNQVQIVPFVDLLLLDESNPRSAAFQLAAIDTLA